MTTTAPTARFAGVDFLGFDTLLSEEERAERDTGRAGVDVSAPRVSSDPNTTNTPAAGSPLPSSSMFVPSTSSRSM